MIRLTVEAECAGCGAPQEIETAFETDPTKTENARITGHVLLGRALWQAHHMLCTDCIRHMLDLGPYQ